jgi:hypothetical protein
LVHKAFVEDKYRRFCESADLFQDKAVQHIVLATFRAIGVNATFSEEHTTCPVQAETRARHCFKPQADGSSCAGPEGHGPRDFYSSHFGLTSETLPEYRCAPSKDYHKLSSYNLCGLPLLTYDENEDDGAVAQCPHSCVGELDEGGGHLKEQLSFRKFLFVTLDWCP